MVVIIRVWSPCELKKKLKLLVYLGNHVSSTESDFNIHLALTAMNRLLIIWTSNRSNKIKQYFFTAVAVSILLYGCTTRTLIRRIEDKPMTNSCDGFSVDPFTCPFQFWLTSKNIFISALCGQRI